MIRYALPDFTLGLRRNLVFCSLMKSSPELFLPDVRIDSVYGCFPGCVANGGRALVMAERYTAAQMDATFSALEDMGVKARLTFTNMLLTPENLADAYLNEVLSVALTHDVEFIVHLDFVGEWVRAACERAGRACVRVLSTTRELETPKAVNEALARYDLVVLNYNRNKDFAFLGQVGHPERLEVMPNELCNPGCPHRAEHYRHNSADQLAGRLTEFRRCNLAGVDFYAHAEESPTIMTNEDVRALNRRFGVEYFKLVGRGVDSGVTLEAYLRYLVRPEHREGLRAALKGMLGM